MLTAYFRYLTASLLSAFILLYSSAVYCQTITISPGRYQLDAVQKLIVCNQVPATQTVPATSIQLDRVYTFANPVSAINTTQFYTVTYNGTAYQLSFTQFPIVVISTRGASIVKDVSRPASFSLIDANGLTTSSWAGIDIHGASSAYYPKKSYNLDFWSDTISRASKDVTLLDMRTDSDWIMLAMYNESLRINNVTSQALWRSMHQLYYLKQEPNALSAIRTRYVDAFVNGSYAGVYALAEQLDRKQLQLKKTKDTGSVRGELYKADGWSDATLFTGMPPRDGNDTTWAGFELKYPNQPGFWTNLYELVDFSVHAKDADFTSQIASKWQLDNLVDYFLFLNLVRATDNQGKNLYIARYKEGEPYIIVAWDLDGTWGFHYDGSADNTTTDILTNGLYNRLLNLNPANFKQKLKARWFSLRTGLFNSNTLKNALASNATVLLNNGAYLREATKWPVATMSADLTYMNAWIDNRTAFLDSYFNQIPDVCTNPTAPIVSLNMVTATAGQPVTLTATGCPYQVVWNTGEAGNSLTVSPWETSTYWAVCNQVGAKCQSPASTTLTLPVLPNPSAPQADLSLSMTSSQRVVPVNTTTRLTLTLTNNGPVAANTIRLQNRLPAGLSFAGNAESEVTYLDGIVNIAVASLAANQRTQFSFDVRPTTEGSFRNATQILMSGARDPDSNPGSGTGDGEDDMAVVDIRTLTNTTAVAESPNPNQRPMPAPAASQPVPYAGVADLSLRVEIDKRTFNKGDISTVKMIVSNAGGLNATGVAVRFALPTGVQYVPGSGGIYYGNAVSITDLSIAAGNQEVVTFQIQGAVSGNWIGQAQISASFQPDPDSTPNNGTTNGEDDTAWIDLRVL